MSRWMGIHLDSHDRTKGFLITGVGRLTCRGGSVAVDMVESIGAVDGVFEVGQEA